MIVLDTNVVSLFMERSPAPEPLMWLRSQPPHEFWTTSITIMEIRFGIELLAEGRRRTGLERGFDDLLHRDFADRILAFDEGAANSTGAILARRQLAGRRIETRDAQIAGIVAARGARLATRNTRHFHGLGIALIDPWTAESA